jgi:hypothetical protein
VIRALIRHQIKLFFKKSKLNYRACDLQHLKVHLSFLFSTRTPGNPPKDQGLLKHAT